MSPDARWDAFLAKILERSNEILAEASEVRVSLDTPEIALAASQGLQRAGRPANSRTLPAAFR